MRDPHRAQRDQNTSMKSKYAAIVRAMYAHPGYGTQIYRISPDPSRADDGHATVTPGSDAERSFLNIWRTAPAELRVWACGRLAASDPETAAELLEDTPVLGISHLDVDAQPASRYRDQKGRPLPIDKVYVDDNGNVVDSDGNLVAFDGDTS